jgi:hypothetical protein
MVVNGHIDAVFVREFIHRGQVLRAGSENTVSIPMTLAKSKTFRASPSLLEMPTTHVAKQLHAGLFQFFLGQLAVFLAHGMFELDIFGKVRAQALAREGLGYFRPREATCRLPP